VIRVFMIENERLVREGLRRVLELDPELQVIGEARDGAEALAMLGEAKADVALLDIRMPKLDGLGVLEALHDRTAPPFLVLTTFDDSEAFLTAVRFGARGYLLKDASSEELGQAIRAVASGGTWLKPMVTDSAVRSLLGKGEAPRGPVEGKLTDRELEVLRFLAGGYSNREIGDALGVAERTVKNHVANVMAKLYVRDRTRAVLKAVSLGLI
jgi:DNA-binding NarL/FixJ family response regulator